MLKKSDSLFSVFLNAVEIPLERQGGVYTLPVRINGVITLNFVLDSGASEVSIPVDVVSTLVRTGTIKESDFLPVRVYSLADGSTLKSPRFLIRELEVGGIKISNVPASVAPLAGELLLGQSLLERLDSWSMDNRRHVLVLGGRAQSPAEKKPASTQVKQSGPVQSTTWKEPITGMQFVLVPGDGFMMGCGDWSDNCAKTELPAHEVCIDSFWIGKFEVAQGEWKRVMGSSPSGFQTGDDSYPVEMVSRGDAKEFAKKLEDPNKGSSQFRLPTGSEWEFACRGRGKPELYSGGNDLNLVGWHAGNSGGTSHPVGEKTPNALGICDMSGNVREWCEDIYDPTAYSKHPRQNPLWKKGGRERVVRGGCWYYGA